MRKKIMTLNIYFAYLDDFFPDWTTPEGKLHNIHVQIDYSFDNI